jgi:hypothetical protein
MYLYTLVFISSFSLLILLFFLRSGNRKKLFQQSWIERLETVARDNHTLWVTQVHYPMKEKIIQEIIQLEKEQKEKGILLKISENGEWNSPANLLKYSYIKRLFKKIVPQITAYSNTLGLDPKYLTLSAWATIYRLGKSEEKGLQKEALFSGCYFLDGGSQNPEASIHFYKKGDEESLFAQLLPHSGDLFLYPGDMTQKMWDYLEEKERVAIYFNVHFGNRKKTWYVSQVEVSELAQSGDSNYELNGESNKPLPPKNGEIKPFLVHISKLKKSLFK